VIDTPIGDEGSKATLTLTVEQLRAENSEKDVMGDRLLSEHTKAKRDFEKHIEDLMEHLNAKRGENEVLQKAIGILEKDYADISAILEEKMSGNPAVPGEVAKLQNQIVRLSEQMTYLSIEHSDLQDQLAKAETEKSEHTKELAQLKTMPVRVKQQKEKKSARRKEQRCAEKSKD